VCRSLKAPQHADWVPTDFGAALREQLQREQQKREASAEAGCCQCSSSDEDDGYGNCQQQ
jgi:hypothetical protein